MSFFNQQHDSISTVQLSPFGEEQWHRIVTYSPIYVHWTDMLMMTQQRPHTTTKNTHGKLNLIDPIDINSLKLEDELLLNELHHIKKAAVIPLTTTLKGKNLNFKSKSSDDEQDRHTTISTDDDQTTSSFLNDSKEALKHHSSYAESSFTHQQHNNKHSVLPSQVSSISPIKTLPNFGLGPKPQSSLSVQLRQSAIARENALSAANDHRSASPLSISSAKRTATSSHSSHRYHQQQQFRTSYLQTPPPPPSEINTTSSLHEQLTGEPLSPLKRPRTRSTNSSRSTMHMLKTKNDRTRQKQNIQLKTLLVEPWKQAPWSDSTLEESIPNSLEIMNKMCGPATAFERNLRHNYHRQLDHYRNGSIKY